jgi:hypothetical protein
MFSYFVSNLAFQSISVQAYSLFACTDTIPILLWFNDPVCCVAAQHQPMPHNTNNTLPAFGCAQPFSAPAACKYTQVHKHNSMLQATLVVGMGMFVSYTAFSGFSGFRNADECECIHH